MEIGKWDNEEKGKIPRQKVRNCPIGVLKKNFPGKERIMRGKKEG